MPVASQFLHGDLAILHLHLLDEVDAGDLQYARDEKADLSRIPIRRLPSRNNKMEGFDLSYCRREDLGSCIAGKIFECRIFKYDQFIGSHAEDLFQNRGNGLLRHGEGNYLSSPAILELHCELDGVFVIGIDDRWNPDRNHFLDVAVYFVGRARPFGVRDIFYADNDSRWIYGNASSCLMRAGTISSYRPTIP